MNIVRVLGILFILSLLSCARVKIKDAEFCGDMGPYGASCAHLLTDETREIPPSQWDSERFGMICSKASAFKDIKAALIKLCNSTRRCSYDVKTTILKFEDKIIKIENDIYGEQTNETIGENSNNAGGSTKELDVDVY